MDWKKHIKDLTEEEIQERKDLLLSSLDIKDDDVSWSKILYILKESNKYYYLAAAMEDTRGDWSDGFGRVEDALENFTVETDLDKEIYDDVYDSCYDRECGLDGRVFRDCEYDYCYIFQNCVEQEFYQKLSFVRKMYTKECEKISKSDTDYEIDKESESETSESDNE